VPNGSKKEPAYIIAPVLLNKSNWTQIYKSGFIKKSDVCNGAYAKYCK
jgi:ABC-type xylose transport system substrate-binding protein